MGDVLAAVIVLVVVIVMITGGVGALWHTSKDAKPETQRPEYRNHLAMARWIEHTLDDDMERVVVPENRQRIARKLLSEFYREDK